MTSEISTVTFNKAVWAACEAFRGTVDPSIYKDYVLTMLFVKYLSDLWQDLYEQYQDQCGNDPLLVDEMMANQRFQLPKSASFYTLYEKRNKPGNGQRIDNALHDIEQANITQLANVFREIRFDANSLGEETRKNDILRQLLEAFAKPELNMRPSRFGNLDIIGSAYEFLIKTFASAASKKAGEFYTPAEVSQLIAGLMEPKEGDEICDPTCGSASLLLKCAAQIRSKKFTLYGQEVNGVTWALAKMNLFLNEVDNHYIKWGDTIRNPKLLDCNNQLKHFDVIVAHPPFSVTKWGEEVAVHDQYDRFFRGLPPKTKGDYAFILHMVATLKANHGRMAVVVPHGVLFRGSSEGMIRKKLIEENLLDAVIGLPEKLLYSTSIPVALLVLRKDKTDNEVLFIDASNEFFAGKNQNILGNEHIDLICRVYKNRNGIDKFSRLASREELINNDYNLNIPLYIDSFEEEAEINLQIVRQEREKLKLQLAELEEEIDKCLKNLGVV